jgi:hypothetical protein
MSASEVSMAHEMSQIKATAYAHIERDQESGGKWVCICDACQSLRSLVGMDKVLAVRPLVRDIEAVSRQLDELPEGPDEQSLRQRYYQLYDALAATMARPRTT